MSTVPNQPIDYTYRLRIKELEEEVRSLNKRIDEVHSWAVCFAITSVEDLAQNFPRIIEITDPDYKEKTS